MNIATRVLPFRTADEPGGAEDSARFVRVAILDDLSAAEPFWRLLEREGALATPYQSFDFVSAWQRHVGAQRSVRPFIVIGFDAGGKPGFLWPMGSTRRGPLSTVSFLGGKHVNFNFALWRRDIVGNLTAADIQAVFGQIAASAPSADVFKLMNQPRSWEGIANPFTLLPHQPSPSESRRLTLNASGEDVIKRLLSSSMRGRLRTKERRLQRLPGYRYLRATTAADVERLLDSFFKLKAAHMALQGLSNIFAEAGNEAFLREACHPELARKPQIEIHALEAEGEMLALFAGINDGRRFSGMFNTYTLTDNARQSPGLILLIQIIKGLADRGLQSFDLGVGEASYKTFFCKEPEPLFDSFLPLTPLGQLAAVSSRVGYRIKRHVKHSHALWSLVQTFRQRLRGEAA
jgi:CelD/BcsL family acetyltransferase involved in cellulose biosynthesis